MKSMKKGGKVKGITEESTVEENDEMVMVMVRV